jgi:GxxExxY protein
MDVDHAAIPPETEHVATNVIGAAITVHRVLGPGFLERIYQEAVCIELHARGIAFERERAIVVRYRDVPIPGQRIDLVVAECVVVELKAVVRIDPIHKAKLMSYLRSTGLRLGLILNFHERTLKQGIKRVIV